MKKLCCILVIFIIFIENVDARKGCCSHHGGVAGCNSNGRQICNDGTLSPTCTCTPTYIYGCTDPKAKNYNRNANKDNGSCTYYVFGCTNIDAVNYNPSAEKDDGTCKYEKEVTVKIIQDNKELEVTYKMIYDKNNNEISREKINEKIIKVLEEQDNNMEDQSTYENNFSKLEIVDNVEEKSSGDIILIILILLTAINFILIKKSNYDKTIMFKVIKIKNVFIKILLLFLYIIYILPIIIDLIILILNFIKNRKK